MSDFNNIARLECSVDGLCIGYFVFAHTTRVKCGGDGTYVESTHVGMFCFSTLNWNKVTRCGVTRVGTEQVEVVVRTLKLVLRSFQRSWMKSEQSSSEEVHASLHRARVDATTVAVGGVLVESPLPSPCQSDLVLFERCSQWPGLYALDHCHC